MADIKPKENSKIIKHLTLMKKMIISINQRQNFSDKMYRNLPKKTKNFNKIKFLFGV